MILVFAFPFHGGRTSLDENPDRKGVVKSQFPDNGNKHGLGVPCAPKGSFVEPERESNLVRLMLQRQPYIVKGIQNTQSPMLDVGHQLNDEQTMRVMLTTKVRPRKKGYPGYRMQINGIC